jgi:hypothetical protein
MSHNERIITLHVPTQVIGAVAELPARLVAAGRERGLSNEQIQRVTEVLPRVLREAPCFYDRMTDLWRYDFGEPLDGLPEEKVVYGTHMCPEVAILFDVVRCALAVLTVEQLTVYLARLADRRKHQDYLGEFAPILRLHSSASVKYEVSGLADLGSTCDWLIVTREVQMALDVKSRVLDLLDSMARLARGERSPDGSAPAPVHETERMLKSVELKFRRADPASIIQGAWIRTEIKQEERELLTSFDALDPSRVHFIVLGDWEEDAYVLARTDEIRAKVVATLQLRESKRFVFNRDVISQMVPSGTDGC